MKKYMHKMCHKLKQQFIGLLCCKFDISYYKHSERTENMIFALERRKIGKKNKASSCNQI